MILTVTLNAAIDKRYVINDMHIGEVNRACECTYFAGGKGLNVSRTAIIAGAEVTATGFVGGYAGDFILEEIGKIGVHPEFIRVNGESRSCINIYDSKNKTQTEILEPGVLINEDDIEKFYNKYDELIKECSVVVISGSVPKGVGCDVYPLLIKKAKDAGKKVIADTSGKLLAEVIKHGPNMIKPNADEIKMLTGIEADSEEELIEAGLKLVEEGIEQVVISLGSKGALVCRQEGVYKATVPKIEAVNTVGCGDCMSAGFAIGFENEMKPADALKFAAGISCAAAMTEETGYFRMKDYKMIRNEVVVEKVK